MRLALVLLLAVPAAALAQSVGQIATDDSTSTINIAQCKGAQGDLGLDDKMEIQLTWNASVPTGTVFPAGSYSLYAALKEPAAGQSSTQFSCTQDKDTNSIATTQVRDVNGDKTFTATAQKMTRTFNFRDIVAALITPTSCETSGSDTGNKDIWLCVQWSSSGTSADGFAKTKLTLNRSTPGAPSNISVSPGDGALYVDSCDGDSDAHTYKAVANEGTVTRGFSNEDSSCGGLKITGLTNGTEYSVVVYAINDANNPSEGSTQDVKGTPVKTNDFYDQYKDAGGREQGGCSTAAGALGLLGALTTLAALARRRKP